MKCILQSIIILFVFSASAQNPCEFSTNVADSLGKYKSTKEYLLYEKSFGGKNSYIFSSIVNADGKILLQLQIIEKSPEFIKVKCFDKNSKIYLQLLDNKIVTLNSFDEETCGNLVRDDKGMNNRILSGYFEIKKDDISNLKNAPISFLRVKFATEVSDYVMKKEFKAELNGNNYEPESYFIDFLHCVEQKD